MGDRRPSGDALCVEAIEPWVSTAGAWGLVQLDDGTGNNRLSLWTQPGNNLINASDYYAAGTQDVVSNRGAVAGWTMFKLAAAYTARNATLVLNAGAATTSIPLHWPGLLFNRLTIGAWSVPGVNCGDVIISRIRGWAAYLATADLQMMTMPIPVAQIGARGADGSGLGGVSGLAALIGNARALGYGRADAPWVTVDLAARGAATAGLRGAITLPGTAISARGQGRSAGLGGSSLGTRNSPMISVIV